MEGFWRGYNMPYYEPLPSTSLWAASHFEQRAFSVVPYNSLAALRGLHHFTVTIIICVFYIPFHVFMMILSRASILQGNNPNSHSLELITFSRVIKLKRFFFLNRFSNIVRYVAIASPLPLSRLLLLQCWKLHVRHNSQAQAGSVPCVY